MLAEIDVREIFQGVSVGGQRRAYELLKGNQDGVADVFAFNQHGSSLDGQEIGDWIMVCILLFRWAETATEARWKELARSYLHNRNEETDVQSLVYELDKLLNAITLEQEVSKRMTSSLCHHEYPHAPEESDSEPSQDSDPDAGTSSHSDDTYPPTSSIVIDNGEASDSEIVIDSEVSVASSAYDAGDEDSQGSSATIREGEVTDPNRPWNVKRLRHQHHVSRTTILSLTTMHKRSIIVV